MIDDVAVGYVCSVLLVSGAVLSPFECKWIKDEAAGSCPCCRLWLCVWVVYVVVVFCVGIAWSCLCFAAVVTRCLGPCLNLVLRLHSRSLRIGLVHIPSLSYRSVRRSRV